MLINLKKDFSRIAFSFVLTFGLFLNLYSGDTGRGGYAGSFLRMGLGAHALAMGGGSAVFVGDGTAAFYNPAGVVFFKKKKLTTSLSSMSLDRSINYIGYAQSLNENTSQNAGFGMGWIGAGVSGIDGRDINGQHTETYSSSENCFYLSFAHAIGSSLSIGVNTKILYYRFPGMADGKTLSARGVGFDVGVLFAPLADILVGVVVKDMHSRYLWNTQSLWEKGTQKSDKFPVSLNAGASIRFLSGKGVLSANYEKIDFMPGTFSAGIEFMPYSQFALRCGMFNGNITFGTGFLWNIGRYSAGFDYAYVSDPVGPENMHVLTGTFIF